MIEVITKQAQDMMAKASSSVKLLESLGYEFDGNAWAKPKPQVRVEYEKVNFSSVGECVQTVYEKPAEYFYLNKGTGEYQIAEYQDAAWYWKEDNLYRRIEKPVDWRDEVNTFIHCKKVSYMGYEVNDVCMSDECFLEMCRIALRANGEL